MNGSCCSGGAFKIQQSDAAPMRGKVLQYNDWNKIHHLGNEGQLEWWKYQ